MKKRNWKVIVMSILVVFLLLFGGLFFYAYQKLSPSEIKKMAIEQTQKVFPNAQVEIKDIQLSPSFSFKLKVEKFHVSAQKAGKKLELFSFDEVKVKIPLWAILTGSGKIEIQSDHPAIHYTELSDPEYANNWMYAMDMKKNAAKKEEKASTPKEDKKISLPSFLSNIKADFRTYDVQVKYLLKDASKGELVISRFLVKDIGLKGQSAFELDSSFSTRMKNNQNFALKTLVVGQIGLNDFLENEKLKVDLMVKLSDIESSLLPKPLPEIKTDMTLTLNKGGKIEGTSTTGFLARNKIGMNFLVDAGNISVNDIAVNLFIKDLLDMVGKTDLLDGVNDSALNVTGNFQMKTDEKTSEVKMTPKLKMSLTPELEFSSMAGKAKVKLDGSYFEESIKATILTQVLGGDVEVNFKGEYDPNMKNFNIKKLKPFNLDINIARLNLTKEFIQKNLYSKKNSAKEISSDDKLKAETTKPAEPVVLPAGTISVSWNKVQLEKNPFEGRALILVSNDRISTKSLNFTFSEGRGELTHLTVFAPQVMNNKFDFKLNGLNMIGLYPFLPPMFEQLRGIFTGTVKGDVDLPQRAPLRYNVSLDLNAKKGEIKGINIADSLNSLIDKLPEMVKSKLEGKKFNFDGNFETFLFKANVSDKVYSIDKFKFLGINNKVEIEGGGKFSPPPSKEQGAIELTVQDNAGVISNQLEKYAGSKILPVKLSGEGILLMPDYLYTSEKLAKGILKKQGGQQLDKLKDKLKGKFGGDSSSGGDLKENIKGALKGLFK